MRWLLFLGSAHVAVAVLALLVTWLLPVGAQTTRTLQDVFRDMRKTESGTIVLTGTVVDDQSQPLQGVRANIQAHVFGPMDQNAGSIKRINGTFDETFKNVDGAIVDLMKPGYHPFKAEYSFGTPPPECERDEQTMRCTIRAVMPRRLADDNLCESYNFDLAAQEGWPRRVWDVRGTPRGGFAKVVKVEESDAPALALFAELIDAETVLLVIRGGRPGDGFIRHIPEPARRSDINWDLMRVAPEEGYANSISITRTDMRLPGTNTSREFYFFYRVDGLYGKGSVEWISFENLKNEKVPNVALNLRLQPDGSRHIDVD